MLSVSQDGNGWTIVTPEADTQIIYVSASAGNNNNNGLSPATPVKTIAKGQSLIRSGHPDQLLLKRGDTFQEYFTGWNKSGVNANQPILISNYGDGARPIIDSTVGGFTTNDGTTVIASAIGQRFINRVPIKLASVPAAQAVSLVSASTWAAIPHQSCSSASLSQ
jgi:hypothetical protein